MEHEADGGHPPTLKDIARVANVSLSTASRVLARSRAGGSTDTPTAERVLIAAAELGYKPNLFAASLRTKRTQMIGVLVPHLTDIVLSTIYEGIDERCAEAGYQTVVANTTDDPGERRIRCERLLQRGVDGLLFGDAHLVDPYLDELVQRQVPFALVNRRHAPHPSATCDDHMGGRLAGTHLADLGHRDIAILAGRAHASTGVDRTEGFLAALRERGIEVPQSRIIHSAFNPEAGHHATLQAMTAPGKQPTAIFAVNDMNAIGAMGALRVLGYEVGHDVALVGFNDISIAADLPTPLSSVRSHLREMGRIGAELLLQRLNTDTPPDPHGPERRLHPELVVRESSDPRIDSRAAYRSERAADVR